MTSFILSSTCLKPSDHIWTHRSKSWALKLFRAWVEQLKWSLFEPYQKFARMVEAHLDGILAYRGTSFGDFKEDVKCFAG
jgi:hypothetical protein